MFRALFVFSFLFICAEISGQSGPRTWDDHLSINSCNSVTRMGGRIYASYYNGLVYFDEKEMAPQKLNKINGLSDVGIRLLRTNPHNNKMMVVYENANIDIIDANNSIINYPALLLKTMSARKTVNEITFDGHLAYLACGFGIVVFDTDRLEIKDTYYIGNNGSPENVYQVALNNDHVFAATASGLYQANRQSSLGNFENWERNPQGLPQGAYNGVINADNKIVCCKSRFAEHDTLTGMDTLYMLGAGGWQVYPHISGQGKTILKLGYNKGELFTLLTNSAFEVINVNTGAPVIITFGFNGQMDYGTLRDNYFYVNHTGNMAYWIADASFGLLRAYNIWDPLIRVTTNGMNARTVSNIDLHEGKIAVSPSYIFVVGSGTFMRQGLNVYEDGEWTYVPVLDENGTQYMDVHQVFIDRIDKSIMWAAVWGGPILEYKNNKLVRTYDNVNSGLDLNANDGLQHSGFTQDEAGNLWFANSQSPQTIAVIKRSNRQYQSFTYSNRGFARKIFLDRNGTFWILHERDGGITLFRHKNFGSPVFRSLSASPGAGNLGSNAVYAIAQDNDGRIWVGTAAGIRVFYNTADIMTGSNIDGQPIKIVQDGNVELLLGAETVTDIQVDGANNKWVGTESGGVYCFSPDGMRQIYHFTKENSPLYSNTIIDLNYNETTGDLYIASEQGLQSFRGTIIAGSEDYTGFSAFPNPVRPGYTGTVLLKGLLDNSVVKITDVAGNLVWEAKSAGGQAEWPVTTLSGGRVPPGVYLVYASTTTAELKTLTKVLVMH